MKLKLLFLILSLTGSVLSGQQSVEAVGPLGGEILENSGLIFYNGKLITHNDSGNEARLYEIDTLSLEVSRVVSLSNVTNIDWEDITQDEDYIYIADFGNTPGTRQDLAVHRISKADYDVSSTVAAETINFSYEDQTDFSGGQNSDWDAEALVNFGDELLIFTKQWQSNGTVAYSIPKSPGTHSARNLGGYTAGGLITGATYNTISNVLYLSGYSQQLQPFLIRMTALEDDFSFPGNVEKVNLNIALAQVEAITHVSANRYFLSSERFTNASPPITLAATLFAFSTTDSEVEEPGGGEEPGVGEEPGGEEVSEELVIFREFGSRTLQYNLNTDREVFGRAIFDATGRRIRFTHADQIQTNTIDLSIYGSAVYYLTFYLSGKTISKPFILD